MAVHIFEGHSVNAKAKGTRRENQVVQQLRAQGYVVVRCPASLGAMDFVALRDGERPILGQVKANDGSPFKSFGPGERAELAADADRAGARAYLIHWPARKEQRWIPPSQWPSDA